MKKRLLAICLALCMIVGLLPTAVLAAPMMNGSGLTADDPMVVPAEGMVINKNTYYGVSKTWFEKVNSDKGTFYVALQIPDDVTIIANDAFRYNYTGDKKEYGAVIPSDNLGQCKVAAIDFSQATNLTTIKYQAAMSCSDISGVLDLSNTKVETIEKSAFNGCTGLTGVIFPSTLKNLTTPGVFNTVNNVEDPKDPVGSVFNGCTGLEFVRTAGGNSKAVFELPGTLKVIGRQSFKGCTGLPENTTVVIPQSVTLVGSEAFNDTESAIGTIVVKADNASDYNGGAFKDNDMGYGLGKRLIVFNSAAAKKTFSPSGFSTYKNACTYEFTLHYADIKTEPKLYGQAVNVCKGTDGSWAVDADYEIPEADSTSVPIGYSGGWAYNDKPLTTTTELKPTGDHLYLDVQKVLQNPTVEFIVNGEIVETEGTSPELQVPAGAEIGVQVSHPIQSDPNADVQVEFEYEWTDVWEGGSEGPRMNEEGFGRYNMFDNPDVTNTITINDYEDERTSAGNYTKEDYGDGYYLLEIYGYYAPKGGGQYKLFYKSASTVIGSDPDRTTNTAYLFDVTIAEPITITPADITIYSGGDSYSGIVNDSGTSSQTTGFPEPGYYITLPDDLNDLLGGAGYAADLSGKLTLNFKDHDNTAADRTWELELYGEVESSAEIEIDGVKRECYIYRIKPAQVGGEEIPAHLEVINAEGNIIESDAFTPESDHQHMDYTIQFCTKGLDPKDLTFKLVVKDEATGQETTYTRGVTLGTGSLVVRGVMDGMEAIREIADTPENIKTSGKIAAVAPSDVTYYVNDSNVAVADPTGVRLLVDSLIDDEDASQAMFDYIKSDSNNLNIPTTENTKIQAKYMDLVDSKNGNAYLTMGDGQKMKIYWPVPSDFDAGTTAHIVHFEALDRDYTDASDALKDNPPEQIELEAPVTVNGAQYFVFETSSFSPFVLVYEQKIINSHTYTLRYNTNGGQQIQSESKSRSWVKAYDELPVPVREGYIFKGWYLDSSLTNRVEEDVKVNRSSVTLYAKWSLDSADPDNSGVSDWLETEEHRAYLQGYGNGSFGPTDKMTRAEVAQMFYNLLKDQDVPVTVTFTDVPEEAWYRDAVQALASLGIVEGIGNGKFAPERTITRAEFTAIAMRFTNGALDGENIFSDVSEDEWFYEEVVGSIQYGWINGYTDGTFRPYNNIARSEVTAITNRMLGRSADEAFVDGHADELRQFPDVSKDVWGYYEIMEATNTHDYTKDTDGETWSDLG